MGEPSRKSRRQSGEPLLDKDDLFPPSKKFLPLHKLPIKKAVVSKVGSLLQEEKNVPIKNAYNEVAKLVYAKHFHDTVYCMSLSTIVRKVEDLYKVFRDGSRKLAEGLEARQVVKDYKELINTRDSLFDVAVTDPDRAKKVELDWGVKMGDMEFVNLDDQRSSRKMECNKGVDPIWYISVMRKQRKRELLEEYLEQREKDFRGKTLDQIDQLMMD